MTGRGTDLHTAIAEILAQSDSDVIGHLLREPPLSAQGRTRASATAAQWLILWLALSHSALGSDE